MFLSPWFNCARVTFVWQAEVKLEVLEFILGGDKAANSPVCQRIKSGKGCKALEQTGVESPPLGVLRTGVEVAPGDRDSAEVILGLGEPKSLS